MKILDKYLLKSFLITFTTVFVILFFIFILQTVWLFISELAGKDLGFFMVIKFLLFAMPRIIPLVLPLSVLLASIMTFGSLAENYEFAAIKSAGISLKRAMKYLTAFILFLSVVTFFFANNVIPYAEYKFINFRRNIAQVQPAMAIVQGQFSEIGTYNIKVDKKEGEKGNFLKGITIHIKANDGTGLRTVIKAKTGNLISSESSNILKLELKDGYYYEEIVPKKYEERPKVPFAKASFKKDIINIDLSKLNTNMDTGEIANTNTMLTVAQLKYTIDSLNVNYKNDIKSSVVNISQRNLLSNGYSSKLTSVNNLETKKTILNNNILSNFNDTQKTSILRNAINSIESNISSLDSASYEMNEKLKNINSHWISLFEKFMIAFSCILMFFIGAPLGAIIRKGGLGLPIVFAVGIFIIFHFINTFGKKVAQQNGLSPFLGVWMSTLILSPFAILLTYRATNDIGLISFENITSTIADFFKKFKKHEKEDTIKKLIKNNIEVKNEKQIERNTKIKHKSLVTFNKLSIVALVINILLFIGLFINFNYEIKLISGLLLFFILITIIFLSEINLLKFDKSKSIGILNSILLSFPFYIIIFIYYKINNKNKS